MGREFEMCIWKDGINILAILHRTASIPRDKIRQRAPMAPKFCFLTANSSFHVKAPAASGKQVKSGSKLPLDMAKKCPGLG